MSMPEDTLRKSSRLNLGMPPVRYSPSSPSKFDKGNKKLPTTKKDDPSSKLSVGSSNISSSIRLKEIELEKLEKLAQIKIQEAQMNMEKIKIQQEVIEARAALEKEKVLEESSKKSKIASKASEASTISSVHYMNKVTSWLETNRDSCQEDITKCQKLNIDKITDNSSQNPVHLFPEVIIKKFPNAKDRLGHPKSVPDCSQQNADRSFPEILLKEFTSATHAMTDAFKNLSEDHKVRKEGVTQTVIGRELPVFGGDVEEWPMFIALYRRSSELRKFTDEENMIRLQSSLRGEALDSVKSLFISPKNLSTVIHVLETRFGRPEFIIESMINKAKNVRQVNNHDPVSIIKFANIVQNLTAIASSLKMEAYLINPQLLNELVSKLPVNLQYQWAREVLKKEFAPSSLLHFSMWIQGESEVAHLLCKPSTTSGDTDKLRRPKNPVFASSSKETHVSQCVFCHDVNHQIYKCKKFISLSLDKRWKWVKEHKKCFFCLVSSHRILYCKKRKRCEIQNCQKYHNRLLHPANESVFEIQKPPENTTPAKFEGNESSLHVNLELNTVLLRIAPITIFGKNKSVETYALFDEGSTVTLIDSKLADEIGSEGDRDPLTMYWTNSNCYKDNSSRKVTLEIQGTLSGDIFKLSNAHTVANLKLPKQSVNIEKMSQKWHHLLNIPVHGLRNAEPRVLIGQDNIDLTIAREVIQGEPNAPVASRTKLGWVIHGNSALFRNRIDSDFIFHTTRNKTAELEALVRENLVLDNLGTEESLEKKLSQQDQKGLETMDRTCRHLDNGKWEIGLLWKSEEVVLPQSKSTALRRLNIMERKMDSDPILKSKYCEQVEQFLVKGYARELSQEEAENETQRTWYLPHFAVKHESKPDKFRFVFDAKAKSNGVSFNDNFVRGPDLLNSLLNILFNFRQYPIVVAGDIQEMFLQVHIRSEDQGMQRFLWRGRDRKSPPKTYQMEVMIFGSICSPSCAIYVTRKNAEEYAKHFPEAAKAIHENHYMDDYLDSFLNEQQAVKVITEVIRVHSLGGFKIRNFISNSLKILQEIPQELRAKSQSSLNLEHSSIERILGLLWNPKDDTFSFSTRFRERFAAATNAKVPSKREVLRIVMSIFDPLGMLAAFTIQGRILLQEIWLEKLDWDENLPPRLFEKWKSWLKDMKKVTELKVPRWYGLNSDVSEIQLHIFCDGSQKAYAAAAYFRIKFLSGFISTTLVMAKSRVTTLKPMTIPRIELQAALLGAKLAKAIIAGHQVDILKTFLWSDSKIVLSWLKSSPRTFKTFVANRVQQILELTDEANWHWLSTTLNIADVATRGSWDIDRCEEWFHGPQFLQNNEESWPSESFEELIELFDEEKKKVNFVFTCKNYQNLFSFSRISKLTKLIRAVAWFLRAIELFKKKVHHVSLSFESQQELLVSELDNAELIMVKQAQHECFHEEIGRLEKKLKTKRKNRLFHLCPFLDENNILRISGRLENARGLQVSTIAPAILEPKHPLSKLIIRHYHELCNHQGREVVLNEIRQKFWILNGRTAVRSYLRSCVICRKSNAKFESQIMGALPEARVTPQLRAFMISGMDYFGPINVKIGRRQEKRYGVLFTCLSTRAVHLELASSLTADSAIMAIRRFICRRGYPNAIYSDNGSNLRGAEKEMRTAVKEQLNCREIQTFCSIRNIQWFFNPPAAPHMGGIWERMVRSVKTALKVILKEQSPREEVLITLFAEAEYSVNSHPLTYVSSDSQDIESLTPNHFLIGKSCGVSSPGVFSDDEFVHRKQWRIAQLLADNFWKRWLKEYVPTLIQRAKWVVKRKNLAVGDIILLADGSCPRNYWPKGVVIKTYPGNDGCVRVVDVNTVNGSYRRPVSKLILLKGADE